MTPIFALFITDFITGATIETVGIAMTIYLVARSLGQMPIGLLVDRIKGERDDMLILIASSFGFVLVSLSYIFIDTVAGLYIVQLFFGLLSAASYPTWYAVFTRSIDKGREGFEWSAYQTIADLGAAITATLGSVLAAQFSFNVVFVVMAVMSAIGGLLLVWAHFILFEKEPKNRPQSPHQL